MKIELDTDQELKCFVCDVPIWPSEPKVIYGLKDSLYVLHPDCASAFERFSRYNSVGKRQEK